MIAILILSLLVTYLTPAVEILVTGWSLSGGEEGLPLRFHKSFFSGYGQYDLKIFLLDSIFWFILILLFWKFVLKRSSKYAKK